jgi:hypothetical protein
MGSGLTPFAETPVAYGFVPCKTVTAVMRHALPLMALYLAGGNTASYLLLTAFDLSLGLVVIEALTPGSKLNAARPARAHWIFGVPFMAVFLAIVAAVLTVPIALPAILFGLDANVHWAAILSRRVLWIAVGCMAILAAVHALFVQAHRERTASTDSSGGRSQAAYAAQITLIATFFLICYLVGRNIFAVPPLFAVLLTGYDVRPDLAEELFPTLWLTKEARAKIKAVREKSGLNAALREVKRLYKAGR